MVYPIGLSMRGRVAIFVGGGAVAERKLRGLLELTEDEIFKIIVIAPTITARLEELYSLGKIDWHQEGYTKGKLISLYNELGLFSQANDYDNAEHSVKDLSQVSLVFAATDKAGINEMVAHDARDKSVRALVNVADKSSPSDFELPAHLMRGDILFTVATNGRSPAISKALRLEMERIFPSGLASWLNIVASLREELQNSVSDTKLRQDFWQTAFRSELMNLVRLGKIDEAEVELRNAAFGAGIKP